jgi:hypothetical protein
MLDYACRRPQRLASIAAYSPPSYFMLPCSWLHARDSVLGTGSGGLSVYPFGFCAGASMLVRCARTRRWPGATDRWLLDGYCTAGGGVGFHQPHLFPSRIGCYSRHRVLFTASSAIHGIECYSRHRVLFTASSAHAATWLLPLC